MPPPELSMFNFNERKRLCYVQCTKIVHRGVPSVCNARVIGGVIHHAAVIWIARERLWSVAGGDGPEPHGGTVIPPAFYTQWRFRCFVFPCPQQWAVLAAGRCQNIGRRLENTLQRVYPIRHRARGGWGCVGSCICTEFAVV